MTTATDPAWASVADSSRKARRRGWNEPLTVRKDEKRDRHVETGSRAERQHVKELVVSEETRHGIRAPSHVHDRSGRVEEAACGDKQDAGKLQLEQLRRGGRADPSERKANRGRKPFRGTHPKQLQQNRQEGSAPDDRQHRYRPRG